MRERHTLRAARAAIRAARHPGDLCAPCVDVLPVTGAAVSVLTTTSNPSTVCASDAVAARLDELQFDLGEGPCWQALDSYRPVLVPDVRRAEGSSWPVFTTAAGEAGAAALFAFPLSVGSVGIGALDLYRSTPGPLRDDEIAAASSLAAALADVVLARLIGEVGTDAEGWHDQHAHSRREVHQATGMILAQLDVDAGQAFALLRARAFSEERSMREVARDVVARRLRFDEHR
ncbi:GAF domain-containing protein [Kineococcus sp. NUM-3379]